jgi:16S rRNA (guanine966-N2)-methyltransferase
MRVVAGTAGGRRLVAPPGTDTRPTTDRVKEATFNALDSLGALDGAVVLDGFAGSGGLGIEALSRGARTCTFVERARPARAAVEANLEATGLAGGGRVVAGDLLTHLATTDEVYDLVLLDPPHATDAWEAVLAAVATRLGDGAVVVVESDRPVVPEGDRRWAVKREKRYGGTVVQVISPHPSTGACP